MSRPREPKPVGPRVPRELRRCRPMRDPRSDDAPGFRHRDPHRGEPRSPRAAIPALLPFTLGAALWVLLAGALLSACAVAPQSPADGAQPAPPSAAPASPRAATPAPAVDGKVVARNERFVIYEPGPQDSLASLAERFLGSPDRWTEIAALSGSERAVAGEWLAIPLRPVNPGGVFPESYQTVPILTYHRIGHTPSRMTVTPDAFAAQLAYLARNGYSVVRLSAVEGFLAGRRALPPKAVAITFDDGYASTFQHAFPLLRQHGFPATVFVYTEFLGARDALGWTQLQQMVASGLIDIQAHSRTHANLTHRLPGESEERYRARLDTEIRLPRELLQRQLPTKQVWSYAYPYGDTNEVVIERLARSDYRLAVTVNPGGNAFFAPPLVLRRTMIFGDRDLDAFRASLQVVRAIDAR